MKNLSETAPNWKQSGIIDDLYFKCKIWNGNINPLILIINKQNTFSWKKWLVNNSLAKHPFANCPPPNCVGSCSEFQCITLALKVSVIYYFSFTLCINLTLLSPFCVLPVLARTIHHSLSILKCNIHWPFYLMKIKTLSYSEKIEWFCFLVLKWISVFMSLKFLACLKEMTGSWFCNEVFITFVWLPAHNTQFSLS